jgi:hypothetical protein
MSATLSVLPLKFLYENENESLLIGVRRVEQSLGLIFPCMTLMVGQQKQNQISTDERMKGRTTGII